MNKGIVHFYFSRVHSCGLTCLYFVICITSSSVLRISGNACCQVEFFFSKLYKYTIFYVLATWRHDMTRKFGSKSWHFIFLCELKHLPLRKSRVQAQGKHIVLPLCLGLQLYLYIWKQCVCVCGILRRVISYDGEELICVHVCIVTLRACGVHQTHIV